MKKVKRLVGKMGLELCGVSPNTVCSKPSNTNHPFSCLNVHYKVDFARHNQLLHLKIIKVAPQLLYSNQIKKSTMKNVFLLLFVFAANISFGQISFKTGDTSFDAELNVINKEAKSDLSLFKTDMSAEFSVSVPKIESLLKVMQPAEALLTLKISKISKQPLDIVTKSYKTNKDKGWGYIAKEMGIKPGSAEFHALKGKSKKKASGKGNSGSKGKSNSKK